MTRRCVRTWLVGLFALLVACQQAPLGPDDSVVPDFSSTIRLASDSDIKRLPGGEEPEPPCPPGGDGSVECPYDKDPILVVCCKSDPPPPPPSDPPPPTYPCSNCEGGYPPADGGGGGEPPPPSSPPADTTGTVEETPSTLSDVMPLKQTELPNCNEVQTMAWAQAYCVSVTPVDGQRVAVDDALDRIAARGEYCARLAERGRMLLEAGQLRHYPTRSGWAPGYGITKFVIFQTVWFKYIYSRDDRGRNLDFALAHELEHSDKYPESNPHPAPTDQYGILHTANDRVCGGQIPAQ
jgi:hypothetical protein